MTGETKRYKKKRVTQKQYLKPKSSNNKKYEVKKIQDNEFYVN